MNPQLELKKFDMRHIKFDPRENKGPVIVFIGKRGVGKSFLIRDLLFYHQDIPIGTVISGTEEGNGDYGKIIPKIFIHNEYKSSIIENILNRQKTVLKTARKEMEMYNRVAADPRTLVILDDCLYDNTWMRDKLMRYIFMNGRHVKIMLIITMQYPLGIPPALRTNIDYVFILRENIQKNRKILYENYAGMFPTFEIFCQIMDQCTENYECLVINNSVLSNKFHDQVFWYKASNHPPYRLCAKEVWEQASKFNSDDEAETYDPAKTTKKSKGPNVVVKKKW